MKNILFLVTLAFLFSCKEQKVDKPEVIEVEVVEETPVVRTQNYAVVWKWATSDTKLIADNTRAISNDLTNLWKQDVVENVYYNSESKVDKLENLPNISFFMKATSLDKAKSILDKLTIVNKGIAKYTIYPVGVLWLGRNDEVINKKGITGSYVAVWNTHVDANDKLKANAKQQSDAVLELWKQGKIENVYFDIDGTVTHNAKTDFVFFVNANTEKEAKAICDKLPFAQKHLAAYEIAPVGVFWMGVSGK